MVSSLLITFPSVFVRSLKTRMPIATPKCRSQPRSHLPMERNPPAHPQHMVVAIVMPSLFILYVPSMPSALPHGHIYSSTTTVGRPRGFLTLTACT